ncbi:MAG: hypothetical protein ACD_9C00001G0003 [uncultured bacterium]|nr:MAG: hypothetical protein ACD_9C00001G0003 [uncultured bacterium]
MDISFIILNYKSEHFLVKCIESIKKHTDSSFEIIVVNNDTDPISTILPEENIIIVNNEANVGFSKACNIGADIAKGENFFFLNPDTEIKTGNISDLTSELKNSSVGIVAPQIILPSGEVQPWSVGHEITLWDIIKNNFNLIKSKQLWKKSSLTEVDWVSGAAFAITKKHFGELAGFDESFFMYFEDVDLCKRSRKIGKKILLFPSIRILHIGGQSSKCPLQQKKYYYASQDYYFKKHFGFFQSFTLRFLRFFKN